MTFSFVKLSNQTPRNFRFRGNNIIQFHKKFDEVSEIIKRNNSIFCFFCNNYIISYIRKKNESDDKTKEAKIFHERWIRHQYSCNITTTY